MAITTAMCTTFKSELLGGIHDLDTHVLKIALIKQSPAGTYNAATTNYSDVTGNSDEVGTSGTNYTTGGQALDSVTIASANGVAYVDIADEVFSSVSLSASGCIIYNSSVANEAICVIDFGGTQTASNGNFTIQFPPSTGSVDETNAIIRIE